MAAGLCFYRTFQGMLRPNAEALAVDFGAPPRPLCVLHSFSQNFRTQHLRDQSGPLVLSGYGELTRSQETYFWVECSRNIFSVRTEKGFSGGGHWTLVGTGIHMRMW